MFNRALYILLLISGVSIFILFAMYTRSTLSSDEVVDTFANIKPAGNTSGNITVYNAFKTQSSDQSTATTSLELRSIPDWENSTKLKYRDNYTVTRRKTINFSGEAVEDTSNKPKDQYASFIKKSQSEIESLNFSDFLYSLTTTAINNEESNIKPPTDNPIKKEIYEYGNKLGELITDFSVNTGNQNQIMSNFAQDRSNIDNIHALEELADKYKSLSSHMAEIEAPTPIQKAASGLIKAYYDVGDATLSLSKSKQQTDSEFLKEIGKYNSAVSDFAKSFIKFSKTLRVYGVTYNKDDPGDIFMPPVY